MLRWILLVQLVVLTTAKSYWNLAGPWTQDVIVPQEISIDGGPWGTDEIPDQPKELHFTHHKAKSHKSSHHKKSHKNVDGGPWGTDEIPAPHPKKSDNSALTWLFGAKRENCDEEEKNEETKVCETKECKFIAKAMLQNIDDTVDPCDNFYEYTCGNWHKYNKMPPTEKSWTTWEAINHHITLKVKDMLEEEPSSDDIVPMKLAKRWYRSCMDTESIEKRGVKPILSIISHVGGWPLAMEEGEWDEQTFSWRQIDDFYLNYFRESPFYSVRGYNYGKYDIDDDDDDDDEDEGKSESGEDSKDEDEPEESNRRSYKGFMILVGPPEPSMYVGRNIPKDKSPLEEYAKLIKAVAEEIAKERGSQINKESLDKDVKDLIEFQRVLFESIEKLGYNTSDVSIDEFQEMYDDSVADIDTKSKFNWMRVMQVMLSESNMEVDGTLEVIIPGVDYFRNVTDLINRTPKRTVVNYMHWILLTNVIPLTTEKLRQVFTAGPNEAVGITEAPPRWEFCLQEVDMTQILAYEFIQRHFPDHVKEAAIKMIDKIQLQTEMKMKAAKWLTDEAKAVVVDKVRSMNKTVGYDDWYKNTTAMKSLFRGLTIDHMYFENSINYKLFAKRKEFIVDNSGVNLNDWFTPLTLNAFYMLEANYFFITAADLQTPLFNILQPDAMNFAIAGSISGHEINHAFDPHGIRYDKIGNRSSWRSEVFDEYKKRAQCFIDQYNKYTILVTAENETLTVDGEQTVGENVADTMGLEAAFAAYQERLKNGKEPDPMLPGLEKYTHEQLFFLSYGNLWCGTMNTKFLEQAVKYDPHTIPRFRVIGSISNSEDFAKAFKCPAGSNMNPSNKCNIWK